MVFLEILFRYILSIVTEKIFFKAKGGSKRVPKPMWTPTLTKLRIEKGEAFNKMDESFEKGMSPEECARRIVKGLQQEKEEILIGGKEIMAIYIKRLFPALFSRIMLKQKVE